MQNSKNGWYDSVWNPVTGCRYGCDYCYAQRTAEHFGTKVPDFSGYPILHDGLHMLDNRFDLNPYPFLFEPTFHAYRIDKPQRKIKPQTIFVCSMADLFGDWVPDEWIMDVFAACEKVPKHRYLFLTKNPSRYMKLEKTGMLPNNNNFWYGSTTDVPDAPFFWSDCYNTFVSIEPMLEAFPTQGDCAVKKVRWIILGGMTGPGSKSRQPKKEWIESLLEDACALDVPVYIKDSLIPIIGKGNMRREFPWNSNEDAACTKE